jgi:hypothetical protein
MECCDRRAAAPTTPHPKQPTSQSILFGESTLLHPLQLGLPKAAVVLFQIGNAKLFWPERYWMSHLSCTHYSMVYPMLCVQTARPLSRLHCVAMPLSIPVSPTTHTVPKQPPQQPLLVALHRPSFFAKVLFAIGTCVRACVSVI